MHFHQDLEIKTMEALDFTAKGVALEKPKIKIYKNPFEDIGEFLEYYEYLGTNAPLDELRAFADYAYNKPKYPLIMDRNILYRFQLKWAEIDYDNVEDIVKYIDNNPFYNDAITDDGLTINWITTYVIAKVELRAFKKLPDSDTQILKHYWLYQEDFITLYYDLGYHKLIAELYDIKGYKWFCEEAWNDPIRYKWTLLAINSKKKLSCFDQIKDLKDDLFNLYESILLLGMNFSDNFVLENVLSPIRKALKEWDSDHLNLAIEEINLHKEQIEKLVADRERIQNNYSNLQSQVETLQNKDYDAEIKIDEIMHKIYSYLSPDLEDEVIKNIYKDFWGELSDYSKRDLYSSITIMKNSDLVDLAILPIARTLEREFGIHFFKNFKYSNYYEECKYTKSTIKKYEVTEKIILEGLPTLGNIPFIGRAVGNSNALNSSKVIFNFSNYLGDKKDEFISICKEVDKYKLGIKKFKIVDIRNGIAHGDGSVLEHLDKNIYKDISRIVLEPPIKILSKIIEASIK